VRPTALASMLVLMLGFGLSGIGTATAQEASPRAIHPPMPVPEMPVPKEHQPSGPAPEATLEAAPPMAEPAPLAPALTSGFAGLDDPVCPLAECVIPPDTHGAVGPNHLMEVLNTEVQVQDRSGAVLWGPVKLDDFWAPVNGGGGTFDPRVLYDPYVDRWIAVAVDDDHATTSALLIAVSQGADPTGAWYFHSIEADPADVAWADYPTVGFNSKWIVVQVNLFNIAGGFNRSHIFVFDKTAMPNIYDGVFNPILVPPGGLSGHSGTQVPALTYDAAEPDLYLVQRWNGEALGQGWLRLYRITGPADSPDLDGDDLDPEQYYVSSPDPWAGSAQPPPPPYVTAPNSAPQIEPPAAVDGCTTCAPGTCLILANDDRIQNVVHRSGRLWTAQTIFLPEWSVGTPTRSSLQWWQIDPPSPITPTVLQRGRVDDPTASRSFAFPSIAVNKHEDVLLGYSSFEGNQYASGSYSFRSAFDPPDTMQPESILKDGEACYYKDFGTTRNRWGDYSATVVDPSDDTKLWSLQEYADLPNPLRPVSLWDGWGTWWGMLDPTRTISIADVSAPEGDSGTTPFTFTLTLSAPTTLPVTVTWDTSDGTATVLDGDYVPVAGGLVTFAPGEVTQTLTVDVNGDIKWEPSETFLVDLSAPTNATLADNQATGTILNDDPLPQIAIGDVVRVEGDAGEGNNLFVFAITLSNPSSAVVQAGWATANGSAQAGSMLGGFDYFASSGTVSFVPNDLSETVTVPVHGDTAVEADEIFYVDLTGPTGGTLLKDRGVGTILDDDAVEPGVQAFGIVADSVGAAATDGRTRLQWLTPPGAAGATQYLIKYNRSAAPGGSCTSPDPADPGVASLGTIPFSPVVVGPTTYTHGGLSLDHEYCYTVWIEYSGPSYSLPGATKSARPFDATQKVKWKYSTGTTTLAAPTVGNDAVIVPSNDMYLHAMQRDPADLVNRGAWPGAPWQPRHLGSVAQHRVPVVPLGGGSRAFISTQDGRVHAVDTANGNLIWSTQLPEGAAQGAPAGIFTAWGGAYDYILVATSSAGPNRIYALDPFTGAVIDAFPQLAVDGFTGMGAVNGMPSVDYANKRVYFASWRGAAGGTVWCLDLGPSSDALSLRWVFNGPNDVNGSVVLHNQHLYVGDAVDTVWSIPEAGPPGYFLSLADGEPKGFLFPDRRGNDLYVATNGKVWAITDDGSALNTSKWATPANLTNPSVVLQRPGTDDIYVGVENYGGTAAVVKIDAATGSIVSSVPLESGPLTIGPPSLDLGYGVLHMGSVAGILYAVELGF
jgi:hypothetical protein